MNQNSNNKRKYQIPQQFSYEFFETNRYHISECNNLQAICNNGFIKLYSIPTRVYWLAQNQFQHRVPDWKIHVSVAHKDVKQAWNLLVELFIKMKFRGGMKVIYLRQIQNSAKGRQITIYIVKYHNNFNHSTFAKEFGVSISDQHSEQYWIQMITEIETIFKQNHIQSNGTAIGDFPLGQYVSLRNQAYIKSEINDEYIYPPDNAGWNPLNHKVPINLDHFKKSNKLNKSRKFILYLAIPILFSMLTILFFQN